MTDVADGKADEERLLELARDLNEGYELYGDLRIKWLRDLAMLSHMILTMPDVRDDDGDYSEAFLRVVTMALVTATKVGTDGERETVIDYAEAMFDRIVPDVASGHRVWHTANHHLTCEHFHLDDTEDLHDLLDVVRAYRGVPLCCIPEEYRYEP